MTWLIKNDYLRISRLKVNLFLQSIGTRYQPTFSQTFLFWVPMNSFKKINGSQRVKLFLQMCGFYSTANQATFGALKLHLTKPKPVIMQTYKEKRTGNVVKNKQLTLSEVMRFMWRKNWGNRMCGLVYRTLKKCNKPEWEAENTFVL